MAEMTMQNHKPTVAEIARRFNCTEAAVRTQFMLNAVQLGRMAEKAERTGKKVNNYTAAELRVMAAECKASATEPEKGEG